MRRTPFWVHPPLRRGRSAASAGGIRAGALDGRFASTLICARPRTMEHYLEAPNDLVPEITVEHAADPDPERAVE